MKLRLLASIPNPVDGTSFYRGVGVFRDLQNKIENLEITLNPPVYDWAMLSFCDVIFMQRPFKAQHVEIAEMAVANCIPLWVDYDDDLFSVPESNPTHSIYGLPETKKNIAKIMALADVVTVTTDVLAKKFRPLNANLHVIPNAFNDWMVNRRPPLEPTKLLVNWRGSPTHEKDVAVHMEAILRLAKEFPNWTWNFIGKSFWPLIEAMPKQSVVQCPAVDLPTYWHLLGQLQPAVQIVPLEDSEFNRAKSNIAWIEASYAGAVTLAPDWPQWRQPGVVTYAGRDGFYGQLKSVLGGQWELEKAAAASWAQVQAEFLLSKINEKRAEILRALTARRKPFASKPLVGISPRAPQPSSASLTDSPGAAAG